MGTKMMEDIFLTIDFHCNQWSVRLLEDIRSFLRCLNQNFMEKNNGRVICDPPIRQDAQVEVSWDDCVFAQNLWYCWWMKSWTTQDVWNPLENGINYQPQLWPDFWTINSTPCNCQSWDVNFAFQYFGTHLVHDFSSTFWEVYISNLPQN